MALARKVIPLQLSKIATGIHGFDELSHRGLPRNRISLLKGGPERRALEAGQIDAILDSVSGKAILLPEGYREITHTAPKHRQSEAMAQALRSVYPIRIGLGDG